MGQSQNHRGVYFTFGPSQLHLQWWQAATRWRNSQNISPMSDTWVDVDEACPNSTLMIERWFEYNRIKNKMGTSLLCRFASWLSCDRMLIRPRICSLLLRVRVTKVHRKVHNSTLRCCLNALAPEKKQQYYDGCCVSTYWIDLNRESSQYSPFFLLLHSFKIFDLSSVSRRVHNNLSGTWYFHIPLQVIMCIEMQVVAKEDQ